MAHPQSGNDTPRTWTDALSRFPPLPGTYPEEQHLQVPLITACPEQTLQFRGSDRPVPELHLSNGTARTYVDSPVRS